MCVEITKADILAGATLVELIEELKRRPPKGAIVVTLDDGLTLMAFYVPPERDKKDVYRFMNWLESKLRRV